MKKMIFMVCCLSVAAGSACVADTTSDIVAISAEQIAKDPGVLPQSGFVSSGQPNEAVLKNFADAGFSTIIDMRMPDEDRGMDDERAVVESLGMTYVTMPIGGADDISFENAAALDELMSGLDQPALVHCGSGNRVGALIALRAKANGAGNEEALAAGKAAGATRMEEVIRNKLGM
jgi:uncharacterized protein (TIGR01244 family)